ncbi:MAG: response regulator, partial [Clostridia bacterium]|nr:response regulator [Clostridia bacterium]
MKVLLADDNPLILDYFVSMLNWNECGVETVLSATDGKKAWACFKKYRPEFVLVDIQMPLMTGIELAKEILAIEPETMVYFLTAYEEFSYVKSALDLGVQGYLLKHEIRAEQLRQVVEKARESLAAKRRTQRLSAEASFHAMVASALKNNPSEKSNEFKLTLTDRYSLLVLEQDHLYPSLKDLFKIEERAVDEGKLKKLCVSNAPVVAMLPVGEFQHLLLLDPGATVETAYNLVKCLNDQFDVSFTILILSDDMPILECRDRLANHASQWKLKYFYPRSSVMSIDYLQSADSGSMLDEAALDALFQAGQYGELSLLMDRQYTLAIERRNSVLFERLTRYFATVLSRYHGKPVARSHGKAFLAFESDDLSSWYDCYSIYQWMRGKISQLAKQLHDASQRQFSDIVQRTIDYVNLHYANADLDVNMIAATLKISANRLNVIFKGETADTIWRYIIRV